MHSSNQEITRTHTGYGAKVPNMTAGKERQLSPAH